MEDMVSIWHVVQRIFCASQLSPSYLARARPASVNGYFYVMMDIWEQEPGSLVGLEGSCPLKEPANPLGREKRGVARGGWSLLINKKTCLGEVIMCNHGLQSSSGVRSRNYSAV